LQDKKMIDVSDRLLTPDSGSGATLNNTDE